MPNYFIGFRSGERLTVEVIEGYELIEEIIEKVDGKPNAPGQWLWFDEMGLMVNLSEIAYVLRDKQRGQVA